jgi:hypothetical protein
LLLPEAVSDQSAKRIKRNFRVRTQGVNRDLGAPLTAQQKHAHDALGVRDLTVLAHLDVGLVSIRKINQLGGSSGMQA